MRMSSRFIVALALAAIAAVVALVLLITGRGAPEVPESVAGHAVETVPRSEPRAPQLEAIDAPTAAAGRMDAAPPATSTKPSTAWYVEMQNSPLRAKMREYARAEKWEEKYASIKDEALRAERESIEKQIEERVEPEMERRFARGAFEIVSTQGAYTGPSYNTCEVSWIRYDESKTWKKVTLPEPGFEDVYKLKALSTWLSEYEHDRPALAARK